MAVKHEKILNSPFLKRINEIVSDESISFVNAAKMLKDEGFNTSQAALSNYERDYQLRKKTKAISNELHSETMTDIEFKRRLAVKTKQETNKIIDAIDTNTLTASTLDSVTKTVKLFQSSFDLVDRIGINLESIETKRLEKEKDAARGWDINI